jgi:hypothetical protein
MQGGIHPDYTGETYVGLLRAVKEAAPQIHIHAFSPLEISQGARSLGIDVGSFLARLKDEGLGTLPGTAAEILDDEVRRVLCPDKINTAEWLNVVASAHRIGLRTTATIMFGHMERAHSWAAHLLAVRDLQELTGGFTEFVPLPFVHFEAPLYLKGQARRGPTWRETLLMHAVARLALHPLIVNIQASWVKLGPDGAKGARGRRKDRRHPDEQYFAAERLTARYTAGTHGHLTRNRPAAGATHDPLRRGRSSAFARAIGPHLLTPVVQTPLRGVALVWCRTGGAAMSKRVEARGRKRSRGHARRRSRGIATCDHEGAELPGDVLVVAQKIISKAEGRIVRLAEVESSPEALGLARISGKDPRIVELILRESEEIVRCVPGLIIARHRLGVVLANAGIDQSNIGAGDEAEEALLWPLDADASADRLRREIAGSGTIAVIVNDVSAAPGAKVRSAPPSDSRDWRAWSTCAAAPICSAASCRAPRSGRPTRSPPQPRWSWVRPPKAGRPSSCAACLTSNGRRQAPARSRANASSTYSRKMRTHAQELMWPREQARRRARTETVRGCRAYARSRVCCPAMRWMALARYSGDWAPVTMTLPPKIKHGTSSMPASLALFASFSTRSTSASLARSRRTKSPSMPQSTAARISVFGSLRSAPSAK